MESMRWLRLAPLALAVVAGAVGIGRPIAGAAGDPAWDPPPCPPDDSGGAPGAAAWYRLDPTLDRQGTLVAMRLTVGLAGAGGRWLALAPESFASGPVGGRVLAGTDDGAVSSLRLLDPARACATAVADEGDVIRSAVIAPDGRSLVEHRVDRQTRDDLGVWRRALAADGTPTGDAVLVLPGLAPDATHGRTFTTELLVEADGRLVASSCGAEACRVRVLDPGSGEVTSVERIGPALGVTGGRLVARAACAGEPCGLVSVDLSSRARATVVEAALAAGLDGATLVYEVPGGRVASLEITTGRRSGPVDAGGVPMRGGSLAQAGSAAPDGTIPLAPGGRPTATGLRAFDPDLGTSTIIGEVRR